MILKKHTVYRLLMMVAALYAALAAAPAGAAPAETQNILLKPGWNAVYLQVQPEPRDPATVFSGLPVESVWTRYDRVSSAEFIQDPAEGLQDRSGWLAYYSAPDAAFANSLYAIAANRPYLIRLSGTLPVTWSVTGAPKLELREWVSDSFNLTGFPLDPMVPVTFDTFFKPAESLYRQAAYRLSDRGNWEFIADPAKTELRAGEAYWLYCSGASTYGGPLSVDVDGGGLSFDRFAQRKTLKISNLAATAKTVLFQLSASFPDKLVYQKFNEASGYLEYFDIAGLPPVVIAPHSYAKVIISVRRQKSPATLDAVLYVTDSEGSRIAVPVSVGN